MNDRHEIWPLFELGDVHEVAVLVLDGDKLFTVHDGKRAMTPMLLVMVAIGAPTSSSHRGEAEPVGPSKLLPPTRS